MASTTVPAMDEPTNPPAPDDGAPAMTRVPVDPWPWSLQVGYHQAELVVGATRRLICAGQAAVDADGAPQHLGDLRGQITLALDNLESVLGAAEMGLADVVRLLVATTDVDAALGHLDVLGARFAAAGVAPPMTLIGVTRLAVPGLLFEIEAEALT